MRWANIVKREIHYYFKEIERMGSIQGQNKRSCQRIGKRRTNKKLKKKKKQENTTTINSELIRIYN